MKIVEVITLFNSRILSNKTLCDENLADIVLYCPEN
jgi:hypothetical protein